MTEKPYVTDHHTPYWVFPQDGDPLDRIGSGLRHVYVRIARKWVYVETRSKYGEQMKQRLTIEEWRTVPAVEDRGQPLAAVVSAINPRSMSDDDGCEYGGCHVR